VGEVQCFDGDGVRPPPTNYEEVVERLRPIFLECSRPIFLRSGLKNGDQALAETVIEVTDLTKPSLLADRLAKKVYDTSDLPLQECYDLPVLRLASMIGQLAWDEVNTPKPPLGICMKCGHEEGEDHVCWHMDDDWGLVYEESVALDQNVAIIRP
jgi:hypothetical protein